jgi:hypothetical protein
VGPEAASLAIDARSGAGNADVLAGEAAADDVNTASPRASVKRAYVIPDRERRETAVVLPSHEHAGCPGVTLDSAHAAPAKELAAKDAATRAGEEGELAH